MNYIIWGINPVNGLREIYADKFNRLPIRNKSLAMKFKMEAIKKGWKMAQVKQYEVVRGSLVHLKDL